VQSCGSDEAPEVIERAHLELVVQHTSRAPGPARPAHHLRARRAAGHADRS
jgi:hypothetical protein